MAEVELWSPQEAADCLGRSVKTLGKWGASDRDRRICATA